MSVDKIEKTPRLPKEINDELRKKFKRMNDYSEGKGKKRNGSERLAMEIQVLQFELKGSMAFYFKEVPNSGKVKLIRQFTDKVTLRQFE